jgi:hypothetical protein
LALTCVVLGLLSLYLAETTRTLGGKITALICLSAAIIVGRMTKSDSFTLALIAAAIVFVILKLRTWILSPQSRLTLRSASAWLVVLALPAIFASVVPLGTIVAEQADDAMEELTRGTRRETEESANLRLHNWGQAIHRGVESGALGLGPGPHLEIPPSIAAGRRSSKNNPKNVDHPQMTLAPNFEVHNTILDLFTQGGLLAVMSVVFLVGAAASATMSVRADALTALLCGVVVFSMFHLIVRTPIVWFAIAFCLVAPAKSATAAQMVRVPHAAGIQT